jgi:hypothetical protein
LGHFDNCAGQYFQSCVSGNRSASAQEQGGMLRNSPDYFSTYGSRIYVNIPVVFGKVCPPIYRQRAVRNGPYANIVGFEERSSITTPSVR